MVISLILGTLLATSPDTAAFAPAPLSRTELLLLEAGGLHDAYEFDKAVDAYEEAMEIARDSVVKAGIEEKLTFSANGRNLAGFCSRPKVVARGRFSLEDFYLYYPLPDKSWIATPNRLDSLGGIFSRADYLPSGDVSCYFAKRDRSGINTVFETHFADTAWTRPEPFAYATGKSEIYPMVCGDKLYFASRGLYGVGGYDLYRCDWNPRLGGWDKPVNMGFPYSSPADDFLLTDTPDGKYTVFASNRGCAPDSVNIYVLEKEVMPVHGKITDPEQLRALCALEPSSPKDATAAATGNGQNPEYRAKLLEIKQLRDTISRHNRELEALRERYTVASGEEKKFLSSEISEMELGLPALQKRMGRASAELDAIEMEMLGRGETPDRSILGSADGHGPAGAAFVFEKHSLRE